MTDFTLEYDSFESLDDSFDLDEKWQGLAMEIIGENKENHQEGLKELKEKANQDGLVLPFDSGESSEIKDKFLTKFLRSGVMDPEKAYTILKNYLRMKKKHAEYFASLIPPTKLSFVYEQQVS